MCGRHSSECNLQDLHVLFPQHGLRLPAAVRENDRTRAATEIKLNSFIFASAAREQNANKQKLYISELWNRSVWKKRIHYLYTTPPPQEFPGPLTPPPHPFGISNPFRGGGMDIFWNHTFQLLMIAHFKDSPF